MYAHIRGRLTLVSSHYAIIDAQGIGFKIFAPQRSLALLEVEQEALLYTSFVVREDFQGLYGFKEASERDLFDVLIDISGVGPKIALALINHFTPGDLFHVVEEKDANELSKVPGIGKKTAERLLVDLKNRKETLFSKTTVEERTKGGSEKNKKAKDALKALIHLGYQHTTAEKALKKALEEGEDVELSSLISRALKVCAKN